MKLTLNKKLMGGFLMVAGLGLAIGLVGLYGLGQSSRALAEIRSEVFDRGQFLAKATDLARSSQVNFKIQVQEWKNTLLRGNDSSQFDKYWKSFAAQESLVQRNLAELSDLLDAFGVPSERVDHASKAHLALGEAYREALTSYDKSRPDAHRVVDEKVRGIDRAATEEIDGIVDMVSAFEATGAVEREQEFMAAAAGLRTLTSISMFLGVALAVGLGSWIGMSLTKEIKHIARELKSGSSIVDSASGEVARYGQSLADSTNTQAASIEEASASLELLSSNTRENAKSAQSATEIANQTRRAVDQGKRHMNEMQEAMGDIRQSSQGISVILKSIDEIAFQTNILALNAAVEAARAGASGAGFAVVADEVRSLAQRSAKAAQETSTRIADSISKSQRGFEISGRMSSSLDEILSKASEVDELVAKIAQSVHQSSEGLDQVNAAIRQIEVSYQTNAALTEESAAAAQELSEQAESLNRSTRELSALVGDVASDAPAPDARASRSPDRRGSANRISAETLAGWN